MLKFSTQKSIISSLRYLYQSHGRTDLFAAASATIKTKVDTPASFMSFTNVRMMKKSIPPHMHLNQFQTFGSAMPQVPATFVPYPDPKYILDS